MAGLNDVGVFLVPFRVLRLPTLFIYGVLGMEACILASAVRVICAVYRDLPRHVLRYYAVLCKIHELPTHQYSTVLTNFDSSLSTVYIACVSAKVALSRCGTHWHCCGYYCSRWRVM